MINTVLMPSGPGRELRHSERRVWKAGHLESPSRAVSGTGRGEGMGEDWTAEDFILTRAPSQEPSGLRWQGDNQRRRPFCKRGTIWAFDRGPFLVHLKAKGCWGAVLPVMRSQGWPCMISLS